MRIGIEMGGLKSTPSFAFEVLSAAELDAVAGGDYGDATIGDADCSCTVSQCHIDGNNEPGTT